MARILNGRGQGQMDQQGQKRKADPSEVFA
jgi:hypothetical protein